MLFFFTWVTTDLSNMTLKLIDNFHCIKIEKHLYYKRCLKHSERQWACLENIFATYKAKDGHLPASWKGLILGGTETPSLPPAPKQRWAGKRWGWGEVRTQRAKVSPDLYGLFIKEEVQMATRGLPNCSAALMARVLERVEVTMIYHLTLITPGKTDKRDLPKCWLSSRQGCKLAQLLRTAFWNNWEKRVCPQPHPLWSVSTPSV